jgi:hypothetical protein
MPENSFGESLDKLISSTNLNLWLSKLLTCEMLEEDETIETIRRIRRKAAEIDDYEEYDEIRL